MELAKVTSKGQITIPRAIRNSLKLQAGDKVLFSEKNGRIFIVNAEAISLEAIQKTMKGKARKAGFKTENDVTAYIKKLRKSK